MTASHELVSLVLLGMKQGTGRGARETGVTSVQAGAADDLVSAAGVAAPAAAAAATRRTDVMNRSGTYWARGGRVGVEQRI